MSRRAETWLKSVLRSDVLIHEYDPVKAREYYLRTRELKGRAEASGDPESVKRAAAAAADAEAKGDDVEAQREVLKAALQAQLEQLEVRMKQLQAAVKAGKIAAMRKTGASDETLSRMISQEVKSPGSTKGGTEVADKKGGAKTPEAGSDQPADDKPKTASQKNKAAKVAKEKYEEEKAKNPQPDEALAELQTKLDEAGEKIQKLVERIEAMNRLGAKA